MTRIRLRLGPAASLLGLLFMFAGAPASVPAQPPEASTPNAPETADADAAPAETAPPLQLDENVPQVDRRAFDAAIDQWRTVTASYVDLVQQWHLAEPSAADRQTRLQWADLQAESRAAFDQAVREATLIARQHLRAHVDITLFLLQAAMHRADQEWYELTGPAIDTLLSAGPESEQLLREFEIERAKLERSAALAFFMTQDYERAEKYFAAALAADALQNKELSMYEALDQVRQWWAEEQAQRDADAARDDLPRVLLQTSRGPVVVELFEDVAPNTVANFISLVDQGFYEDNPFYQVLPGIVAVTGDPRGDGSGDAGYFIGDEHQRENARRVFRGSLVMAKLPDGSDRPGASIPNTASSQFVIALAPLLAWNDSHTVFGRVVEGLDALVALTPVDPKGDKKKQQAPPDLLFGAEVLRKREHPYVPEKFGLSGGAATTQGP